MPGGVNPRMRHQGPLASFAHWPRRVGHRSCKVPISAAWTSRLGTSPRKCRDSLCCLARWPSLESITYPVRLPPRRLHLPLSLSPASHQSLPVPRRAAESSIILRCSCSSPGPHLNNPAPFFPSCAPARIFSCAARAVAASRRLLRALSHPSPRPCLSGLAADSTEPAIVAPRWPLLLTSRAREDLSLRGHGVRYCCRCHCRCHCPGRFGPRPAETSGLRRVP